MTEIQQLEGRRNQREFEIIEPYSILKETEKLSNEKFEEINSKIALEITKLKAQYHRQLTSCKELFPDWTDEDLLCVIQETSGDFDLAITRISQGRVGRWGEVKKKNKDKTKKQDSLQNSALSIGCDKTTSRDKIRDPKNIKNKEPRKRENGRLNGTTKRDRQTKSGSTPVTWDTLKNSENHKDFLNTTRSHTKSSWSLYQQPRDPLKPCQNVKKNMYNNKIPLEYDLKETEDTAWEDLNPANQDSRSVSAWSDAATKASSATAGWCETGSFCVSNTESQSPTVSKSQTKIPPGGKLSWASLLKQEPVPDTQEQISPISKTSYRSDENYTNTFSVSKMVKENEHEIINGTNHIPITSKTPLTASNLESINKENIEHIVSLKNTKNSTNITSQSLNNHAARFHEFNKSHSSKSSYHRHLNQDAPVVMPNSSNISERVGVRFGSLNLAGQENTLFLNKEKSKLESNSIPKNVPMKLHSSVGSTLQKSKSIENSEKSELRQQSEKIYSESSNTTQQPYPSSNHVFVLPSNLNRSNQQSSLPEHKHTQYESYDQSSYGNYANHQVQDQPQNFRNFLFPNEYQGFYRSDDPRPHFAQGYYDPSTFPREQLSDTAIHRDISNTANEYIQTSRFDPGVLEGSSIPSHHGVSDPVMPKHIPADPSAVLQHHSSAQSHYHQTQTYPIHPYYNPYATYYMNQYGYGNYPYTKQNIYNQPQDYSRPYNENSYVSSNTNEKFNEHRADLAPTINLGKSREYPKSKSQNSSTNQSTQWSSQQKNASPNNPLEYTGEKLNTISHQGNPLQQMQNFQQSSIRPIYPGSSYTYSTHLPQSSQQPPHQGTPGVPGAPTQTAPASLSYSLRGHTIGYHGPYQSLLNHQDHPNVNWANYPSH
ncbi:hypothetical protein PCK1_002057 [Pneumocystis canis]|nr:hypothetical protein PCK1_002057 [Pneumocystis canis]